MIEVNLLLRYKNQAEKRQRKDRADAAATEEQEERQLLEKLCAPDVRVPKAAEATLAVRATQQPLVIVVSGAAMAPTQAAIWKAGLSAEVALATELEPQLRAAMNGTGLQIVVDDGEEFQEACQTMMDASRRADIYLALWPHERGDCKGHSHSSGQLQQWAQQQVAQVATSRECLGGASCSLFGAPHLKSNPKCIERHDRWAGMQWVGGLCHAARHCHI